MTQDELILKIISIFYYFVGVIVALFASFPIIHFFVGIGTLITSVSQPSSDTLPLMGIGFLFTLLAGGVMLFGWACAVCLILAGRFLATRTHYMFCIVMAGVACMFMPFGTVLGIFTIIFLVRPSVKELFQGNQSVAITTEPV